MLRNGISYTFVVGNYRKVRVRSVISIASNHEREKQGLESKRNSDTTLAIEISIEAIKKINFRR